MRVRFLPQMFVLVCFLLKDCPNAAEGRVEYERLLRMTREKYPKPSLNFVDFIFLVRNEEHFK